MPLCLPVYLPALSNLPILLLYRIVYENVRAYPEYLVRYYRGPYDASRGPQTRPASARKRVSRKPGPGAANPRRASRSPPKPQRFDQARSPAPAPGRDPPPLVRYGSINPQGGGEPYDAADSAKIHAAKAAGALSLRLDKPYGEFEIRFGANATSGKMPSPPESQMIQVNLQTENTRVVYECGQRP